MEIKAYDSLPATNTQPDLSSLELSSRRTGMSFQRTRLSAERTLMSVIRTALSLITFGFTIYQTFHRLHEAHVIVASDAPRRFGAALVLLGIAMLAGGIAYQLAFMRNLRRERQQLRAAGIVHADSAYPVALSLLVALALLAIGVLAFLSMLFHHGPFG